MESGTVNNPPQEEERIFHMWEPLKFQTKRGHDYLRNRSLQRAGGVLLRAVAAVLLSVFDRAAYGLKIEGRENLEAIRGQGAVIVCNHIHPMDCTMIDLALWNRRMYYVTLECNFRIPLIRHLVRILGGVPLSREPHCMKELFSAMAEAIERGACVQIYPEGVLDPYCGGLRQFKNGAFRLAASAGAPVVPAVLTLHEPRGLYRLYKKKPCFHLHLLPPVFPEKGAEPREEARRLLSLSRERMEQVIEAEKEDRFV